MDSNKISKILLAIIFMTLVSCTTVTRCGHTLPLEDVVFHYDGHHWLCKL